MIWQKRDDFPASGSGGPRGLAVDRSGNVLAAGRTWSSSPFGFYTAKYSAADGALLWEKRHFGPPDSQANSEALSVDGSDNVVVTGEIWRGTNSASFCYTAKYAAAN